MMRVPVVSPNGAVSAELVHASSAIIRHCKSDVLRTRHPYIEKRTAPSTWKMRQSCLATKKFVKKGLRCIMVQQITRLKFWAHKSCSKLSIFWTEHSPRYRKKIDAQIAAFENMEVSEELQQLAAETVAEYEEYMSSEPVLVPQDTMLFSSGHHSRRCNFLTARRYRAYIRMSYIWAQKHGINTFIADYTTPFGLLALETLLELRSIGEDFTLYTINSRHIGRRKSYRLIWETDLELAWILAKCDYRYQCLYSADTLYKIYLNSGTHCNEDGIQRKR
ncbi:hypothetical protein D7V91_16025 [bacterium 1xD42-67]|nr:hypothetical protein D7V91_16025 [bacterium 1xD42-67]